MKISYKKMKSEVKSRRNRLFPLVLGFAFITILFSACKKELGVYLLNEMKNENPYSGTETLKYKDNSGNEIIFEGAGRYSSELHSLTDPTSTEYYYLNEIDRCTFTNESDNYVLYIQLASRTISEANTGYLMDMWFSVLNNDNLDTCKNWVSTSLPIKSQEFKNIFYDSLLINSVYYYDVIAFERRSSNICEGSINADSMFYCTSHGIVKLSLTNGEKWELESVEW